MNKMTARLWTLSLIQIIVSGFACEASGFDRGLALTASQSAIDRQLDNFQFRNTERSSVNIADYLGKPLIISLIYTTCHETCPTTTKNLAEIVLKAREALGSDSFNVITIGFDVFRDTPAMMSRFRDKLQVSDDHWQFLSADAETMEQLTTQLGFLYEPSPKGFDHQVQASLITPRGKVTQQIYGVDFDLPILVEPLKRLVFSIDNNSGILTTISNKIQLCCTVFDPSSNKYRFRYSIFVKFLAGFVVMLLFGIFLVSEWRKTIHKMNST